MTPDLVISALQKKYTTDGPIYLSNFFLPGGEKWLYEQLQSVYRAEFQNNYRLIVVQDCPDVYEYSDLPGTLISTLQKYVSQIDISNFFILVVTGNKNIGQELEQARILYSTDKHAIQHQIIDALDYSQDDSKKQDTFCILPWMHLYLGTDGNVLPCCVADQQHPMGNIDIESIDTIIKSKTFNTLRKNMLTGQRSKECSVCYKKEDNKLPSSRQGHNSQWGYLKNKIVTHDNGTIDKFEPVYLDIRLNNICNLKCRMCSGYFSSSIAQENAILFNNTTNLQAGLSVRQRSIALNEIIKYVPSAEKIYFAGGEPLLTAEHYTILQALIDCGNTDLEIFYNTNFTNLKYKNINILDIWKKFKNIRIGASLDAIGAVAEYVRHGTVWNTVEDNLKLLKLQCPHVNFTVTSAVGLLNVSSLIELQKKWHQDLTLDISKFSLTVIISPDHLAVSILPEHHKQRLDTLVNEHITWCKLNGGSVLAFQWTNVLKYMWATDLSHHLSEFKRLTNTMDDYRNESFYATFPEYRDLI